MKESDFFIRLTSSYLRKSFAPKPSIYPNCETHNDKAISVIHTKKERSQNVLDERFCMNDRNRSIHEIVSPLQ